MSITDICTCIALITGSVCMVVMTCFTLFEFKNISAIDLKTYIEVKKAIEQRKKAQK